MNPAAVAIGAVVMIQIFHSSTSLSQPRQAPPISIREIIGYYVQKSKTRWPLRDTTQPRLPRSARDIVVGPNEPDANETTQGGTAGQRRSGDEEFQHLLFTALRLMKNSQRFFRKRQPNLDGADGCCLYRECAPS
jgi:hypothetical protein